MEDYPAGHEDLEMRILLQQKTERVGSAQDVFEVVENQQAIATGWEGRLCQGFGGLRDELQHNFRIADGGQRDKVGAIRLICGPGDGYGQRDPRLTAAARPG